MKQIKKKIYRFPKGYELDAQEEMRDRIRQRLATARMSNIEYDSEESFVLGFMGTTPEETGVEAYSYFLSPHPNNIGEHTRRIDELGFPGTQQLEREVISMLGDLYGDPEVDGYLSFDGTEANLQAHWVAREYLMNNFGNPKDQRVCLLTNNFCHYSAKKAYRITRLGGGLIPLPTNEKGEILISALKKEIEKAYENGLRRFLIIAVAGSTLLGSIDDVAKIGEAITQLEEKYNSQTKNKEDKIGFYLHVDAAFGGFVAPFLKPPIKIGFDAHNKVHSITTDPHKMGLVPYPAGAFLCRNGLIEIVEAHSEEKVEYVGGHHDFTVSGSRPGAAAAACWAVFHYLGRRGYERKVQRCMEVLEYFRKRMSTLSEIELLPHTINILAFKINDDRLNRAIDYLDLFESWGDNRPKLKYEETIDGFERRYSRECKNQLYSALRINEKEWQRIKPLLERYWAMKKKYILVTGSMHSNPTDLKSPKIRIMRFVLMPHRWLLEKGEYVANMFVEEFRQLFV